MSSQNQVTCWIASAGVIGMENQCKGLAEVLDLKPIIKKIVLRSPWRQLAPFLRRGLRWAFAPESDSLKGPYPDIVICSGRAGGMAALHIQREAKKQGKRVYTVYIQNPVIDPSRFDVVAVPRHDRLEGETVITTRGSLHRVTDHLLSQEAKKFEKDFADLPAKKLAVLIGGSNSVYQLTPNEMKPMAHMLAKLAREKNVGLMVTASRRTGAENLNILQEELKGTPHKIWDGTGANPYYAMLGLADTILVTADSVNMASEACSTGKPVYILPLAGGSAKFRRFHQALRDDGMTRPFKGELDHWTYQKLIDVELVANRIREVSGLFD